MSTVDDVYSLAAAIRKQYRVSDTVSTCNPCPECGNNVIGAGKCADCLTDELGVMTNLSVAETFRHHTQAASNALARLVRIAEDKDKHNKLLDELVAESQAMGEYE